MTTPDKDAIREFVRECAGLFVYPAEAAAIANQGCSQGKPESYATVPEFVGELVAFRRPDRAWRKTCSSADPADTPRCHFFTLRETMSPSVIACGAE
jgi:hypothetical protein